MQFTLISVGVIQKHLLIQFGSQFLTVEYLGGCYVYRFKVNYIYQHGDLIILVSYILLKINSNISSSNFTTNSSKAPVVLKIL